MSVIVAGIIATVILLIILTSGKLLVRLAVLTFTHPNWIVRFVAAMVVLLAIKGCSMAFLWFRGMPV